ncbi:hypothetical protein HanRHA438_Chr09g0379381 [Helianthus annuus]|nr:hypothetical protein HanIR_Chr09g0396831 [Helianthus annuus]KAJ0886435.1 hypothetical protein HanRHA438_Chr09g0379381 [Helianthus annuus]
MARKSAAHFGAGQKEAVGGTEMKTVRLLLIVERTKSSKTGGSLGCYCRKQVKHTTKPVIIERKQKQKKETA